MIRVGAGYGSLDDEEGGEDLGVSDSDDDDDAVELRSSLWRCQWYDASDEDAGRLRRRGAGT